MYNFSQYPFLLIASLLLFITGCDSLNESPDNDTHTATEAVSNGETNSAASGVAGTPPRSTDELFLRLSEEMPGFGGLFFEKDRMNIYMQNTAYQGQQEAQQKMLATLSSIPGTQELTSRLSEMSTTTIEGQYSFGQLMEWRSQLRSFLPTPGMVSLGVSESENRVRMGVEKLDLKQKIDAELERLSIPNEAVLVEQEAPVIYAKELTGSFRNPKGGVQVQIAAGLKCSFGFNVQKGGFITNSHCTNNDQEVGGNNFADFYQPLNGSFSNLIGDESDDPPLITPFELPVCPRSTSTGENVDGCRYSDAAYIEYSGASGDFGTIARTRSISQRNSTPELTVDSFDSEFTITSEQGFPYRGDTIYKMGRSSGWTEAVVGQTCVDLPRQSNSGYVAVLLCQDQAQVDFSSHRTMTGDSGSPIFSWSGGDNVGLVGLLWGTNPSGRAFYLSALSNIQRQTELGSLTVY